jgi:hypothetical protein
MRHACGECKRHDRIPPFSGPHLRRFRTEPQAGAIEGTARVSARERMVICLIHLLNERGLTAPTEVLPWQPRSQGPVRLHGRRTSRLVLTKGSNERIDRQAQHSSEDACPFGRSFGHGPCRSDRIFRWTACHPGLLHARSAPPAMLLDRLEPPLPDLRDRGRRPPGRHPARRPLAAQRAASVGDGAEAEPGRKRS